MTLIESVMNAFVGMQLEICIFVLAAVAHAVLFGRYQIFEKPGKKPGPSSCSRPPVVCLKQASACFKAAEVEEAVDEKTGNKSVRATRQGPNIMAFHDLLERASQKGAQAALTVVKSMKDGGLRPNRITCSILLKSVTGDCTSADLEKVMALVDTIEETEKADEVLISSICEACIRCGRAGLDRLSRLLAKLRAKNYVNLKGAHTFGSIVRAYGILQDLESAREAWREMTARNVQVTSITLGCMVEALSTNGMPGSAHDLIKEYLKAPEQKGLVNAVIYGSVLKGFVLQKRYDLVWRVEEEMRAGQHEFSLVTYNAIINACAGGGQMCRVEPLLREMEAAQITPNVVTFSTILKGYCMENRLKQALELLEHMKTAHHLHPDEVAYNTLLDGCARFGDYKTGMAVLADMEAYGVALSNFTLCVLAKLAHRSRKPEKAFELCEQMAEKYKIKLNLHVYNNLIQAGIGARDLPRSLEVFRCMLQERVRPDERTYSLLLRGCITAGSSAAEVAEQLLRTAAALPGALPAACAAPGGLGAAQPKGGFAALDEKVLSECLDFLVRFRQPQTATLMQELPLRSSRSRRA